MVDQQPPNKILATSPANLAHSLVQSKPQTQINPPKPVLHHRLGRPTIVARAHFLHIWTFVMMYETVWAHWRHGINSIDTGINPIWSRWDDDSFWDVHRMTAVHFEKDRMINSRCFFEERGSLPTHLLLLEQELGKKWSVWTNFAARLQRVVEMWR